MGGKPKLARMRHEADRAQFSARTGDGLTESCLTARAVPGMDFPEYGRLCHNRCRIHRAGDFVFDDRGNHLLVPTEQAKVFVHLLPKLIPPGSLRGGLAVVVDVLRATTVMVQALAAGCEAIIPCGEIRRGPGGRRRPSAGHGLAGRRAQGLPIAGFDLGNSPGDFTPDVCRDKTIVMTTTNGTRAILASLEAERVYIAGFTNLRATSDEISVQFLKKDHGHSVHIVCAGTEGQISLEDSLLAGALTSQIANVVELVPGTEVASVFGNDEALMVVSSVARSRTISREASVVEIAEPGAWRAECACHWPVGRYRRGCPLSTGTIWLPSSSAIRCESWPFDAVKPRYFGVGPAKVVPQGEVRICWTTWTSWSRCASAGGLSFPRARFTAGLTDSGTMVRWALSSSATSRKRGGATTSGCATTWSGLTVRSS